MSTPTLFCAHPVSTPCAPRECGLCTPCMPRYRAGASASAASCTELDDSCLRDGPSTHARVSPAPAQSRRAHKLTRTSYSHTLTKARTRQAGTDRASEERRAERASCAALRCNTVRASSRAPFPALSLPRGVGCVGPGNPAARAAARGSALSTTARSARRYFVYSTAPIDTLSTLQARVSSSNTACGYSEYSSAHIGTLSSPQHTWVL